MKPEYLRKLAEHRCSCGGPLHMTYANGLGGEDLKMRPGVVTLFAFERDDRNQDGRPTHKVFRCPDCAPVFIDQLVERGLVAFKPTEEPP